MSDDSPPLWPFVVLVLALSAWLVRRTMKHQAQITRGQTVDPATRKGIYIDVDSFMTHPYTLLAFEVILLAALVGFAPHMWQSVYNEFHALEAGHVSRVRENALLVLAYRLFGAKGAVAMAVLIWSACGAALGLAIRRRVKSLRARASVSSPPADPPV